MDMNKKAYKSLVDENIEFSKKHLPDGLEKDHILKILETTVEETYPKQRQEVGQHDTLVTGMPWISVYARLPEEGETVLVFPGYILCQYGIVDVAGDTIGIENEFSYFYDYKGEDRKPDFKTTHWMELPKPPKQYQ